MTGCMTSLATVPRHWHPQLILEVLISLARLVITAVIVEGRSKSAMAATGPSELWEAPDRSHTGMRSS